VLSLPARIFVDNCPPELGFMFHILSGAPPNTVFLATNVKMVGRTDNWPPRIELQHAIITLARANGPIAQQLQTAPTQSSALPPSVMVPGNYTGTITVNMSNVPWQVTIADVNVAALPVIIHAGNTSGGAIIREPTTLLALGVDSTDLRKAADSDPEARLAIFEQIDTHNNTPLPFRVTVSI
jgi:hypothetical protein